MLPLLFNKHTRRKLQLVSSSYSTFFILLYNQNLWMRAINLLYKCCQLLVVFISSCQFILCTIPLLIHFSFRFFELLSIIFVVIFICRCRRRYCCLLISQTIPCYFHLKKNNNENEKKKFISRKERNETKTPGIKIIVSKYYEKKKNEQILAATYIVLY